ncbi:hypothetical protein ACJJTC_001741 [Scirpophaga incertulas]
MSEPEQNTGGSGGTLMVDKTVSDQRKPFRPTDLQEESLPELHNRSRAPAISSVEEDLKNTIIIEMPDSNDHAISCDKHEHVVKKLSSNKRKRTPPEDIAMALMDSKPIPAAMGADESKDSSIKATGRTDASKILDDESITKEVDVRTEEVVKKHSEWSDDEEAGGLPRSESRASRVSRAVRQLFCCGVTYSPPSEEDITPRSHSAI